MTTPFVILFEGRSGSTWLVEALRSHPRIEARLEVFAALRNQGHGAEDQLEWARGFLAPPFPDGIEAAGFKTKLHDVLDTEAFAGLLHDVAARVVLLRRRNRVKHVVSVFNAMRIEENTGEWNLRGEGDTLSAVSIDPERFDEWLESYRRGLEELERYVDLLDLPTCRIHYEDLLRDPEETTARVTESLAVEPAPLETRTRKATSDDLREALANFEELRRRYEGTRYGPMFDDVVRPDPVQP